jgi:hypothetical protein
VVVAVAAIMVPTACGRIHFALVSDADDAGQPDDAFGTRTCGVFSAPEPVAELANPTMNDYAPFIAANDLTLYVSGSYMGSLGMHDIWAFRRSSPTGPFDVLEHQATISGPADDQGASVTDDELIIMFNSTRPGVGSVDIWMASRSSRATPFDPPTLVAELSSPGEDSSPRISGDGLAVYFASDRAGSRDLYTATRPSRTAPFDAPQPVTELNTTSNDRAIGLSSDRLEVFVMSNRPGGTTAGEYDLWTARRTTTADPFGTMENATILNSPIDDGYASLSADGTALYFNHALQTDGSVDAEVWVATRECTP